MPWNDWQFWLVTMLAFGGLVILLRPFIPFLGARRKGSDASCPSCASGSASTKKRGRRVALTIEKRRVS